MEYRIACYVAGKELWSPWKLLDKAALLEMCGVYADNGFAFSVEFR